MRTNNLKNLLGFFGIVLSLCATTASASLSLDPSAGANDQAAYEKALEYLSRSPKAQEVIAKLQASETAYHIVIGLRPSMNPGDEPGNMYDPAIRTIYWMPSYGFRWKTLFSSLRITPALGLLHEMGHAYHQDIDSGTYEKDIKATMILWDTREEKRTIREIENVVAKDLGESLRNQHDYVMLNEGGQTGFYQTQGPISVEASVSTFANLPL